VGLAGVSGALAGCSTAAVPYNASEAGVPQGAQAGSSSATPSAQATGTLLGLVTDVPVGGGKVFMSQKVVVTQPMKGVFHAFSAVCTHVGCVCNQVASGTINCPCHGSKFKIADGSVVTGPAPAPLPPRTISVTNGKIMLMALPRDSLAIPRGRIATWDR
jgi:Rieske Fe-S protein